MAALGILPAPIPTSYLNINQKTLVHHNLSRPPPPFTLTVQPKRNFPPCSFSVNRRRGSCFPLACLPTPPRPKTRLFVSGLSFRTTEDSLRNAFQGFGQLLEVNLVMDKIANRPRGFAFIRYATEEESQRAIKGMHGKFLDGRVIFVEIAKARAELRQAFKQNPMQN